ncbi:Protein of unknown function [Bacillus cereus]|uniref:Uncharacterized protein n=1 Tax=Bacillus wiedmannii TaxID=1890302 RepID=A0A1C4BBN7_9BACI|nr:Protein of unknown function [Bacillus cereus]SCC07175.1 Protein of unknown function [Bacillus wiedmannii]SCL87679.1 Protein of unknown function [Bacillus wiedmannii]SCN31956.1 Protein of unknown function [Bacillus wiedmannii]
MIDLDKKEKPYHVEG